MKMNNDCSIDNIGFLLYMEEQERKQKEKEEKMQEKDCKNIMNK